MSEAERPASRRSFSNLAAADAYFLVESDTARRLVVVRRTARAFDTLAEAKAAHAAIVDKLGMLSRRSFRLLVDLRSAPLRSDPEFESAIAAQRKQMLTGFARVAVIVRTAAGRMQVTRHIRDDISDAHVYLEEAEAMAFLEGADASA